MEPGPGRFGFIIAFIGIITVCGCIAQEQAAQPQIRKLETKLSSIGVSVQSLTAGRYSFKPASSGFVNRDFKDVKADGRTYSMILRAITAQAR